MMKAAYITSRPDIGKLTEHLQLDETTIPTLTASELKPNQVLIHVKAFSINIDDVNVAQGSMLGGIGIAQAPYPTKSNPHVPGSAYSGTIQAVGSKVTDFLKGDRVFGFNAQPFLHEMGPWAERTIGNPKNLLKLPNNFTFVQGAALVMPLVVAGDMYDLAVPSVAMGTERVMVLGASGGIGSVLVQALRKKFPKLHIVGVCSSKSNDFVMKLGANSTIDYNKGPIHVTVLGSSANDNSNFDVILDCVGGYDYYQSAEKILAPRTGTFITCTGTEQWIGDRMFTRLEAFQYLWQTFMVPLIYNRLPGKHPYYYFAGPMTFGEGSRMIMEQKTIPGIEKVIPFEEDALKSAINLVAAHRAKGKIVVNLEA
ncbi:unnamed protein product [Cylindrotheca closterium]|uniref:Enoyl reductase (ER) domain-containing protein n=1 Tax=Cylindrotheca closterium TaxID=2856 RepID=A0AAD2PUT2_9STRA|nr:unnamed protein product [Cylindrotheca closterium]